MADTSVPHAVRIALVGDRDDTVVAHQAIPEALRLAAARRGLVVDGHWVPTDAIRSASDLRGFHGIWCVPGSPYRSVDGALTTITEARMSGRPFLGTCGGFQHLVLEYARSVLGWADAEHAETAPAAPRAVISPLTCSLVEVRGRIRFAAGSRLAAAYGECEATEGYHCRYGLNPAFAAELLVGPLRAVGWDDHGDVRAVELTGHDFFVGTLFQPERAALIGVVPAPVEAFVAAASAYRRDGRRDDRHGT